MKNKFSCAIQRISHGAWLGLLIVAGCQGPGKMPENLVQRPYPVVSIPDPASLSSSVSETDARRGNQPRNNPAIRESPPAAIFPHSNNPPQYPQAGPQTHGLDLSRHDEATAKAYFDWLCANEAGEWIYKAVDNVESVFEMRRRVHYPIDWVQFDRYYLEDPFGYHFNTVAEWFMFPETVVMSTRDAGSDYRRLKKWADKGPYIQYQPEVSIGTIETTATTLDQARYGAGPYVRFTRVWPTHPEYDRDEQGNIRMFQDRRHLGLPFPPPKDAPFKDWWRYSKSKEDLNLYLRRLGNIPPQAEITTEIKSRYGFMWRGISRSEHDRDLGIAGLEVLVFDLSNNELMAVRRNFLRVSISSRGLRVNWQIGKKCMEVKEDLHAKVLKPINPYVNIRVEKIQ